MAFLTSQRGAGTPNVAKAFTNADTSAIRIKAQAVNVRDKAQAGTVNASDVLNALMQTLRLEKAALMAAAGTPGIAAYASDQYSDVANYAVGTEFSAMMTEVDATISFFITNHPNASGSLTALSWNPDNSGALISYSGYSVAQRNAMVTRLNALLATID